MSGWRALRLVHVNVSLVGGGPGLLVVDTHGSERMAREVASDVRRLGAGPLTAVVNTHEHLDHTFGNVGAARGVRRRSRSTPTRAAEHTVAAGERAKQQFRDEPGDPHAEEVLETRIVAADQTFSSIRVLDLGDRQVELIHPGRGHTAGDLVVRVPDADVLARRATWSSSRTRRSFGADSWPIEWPATLDLVLGLLGAGHAWSCRATGSRSTRSSCEDQRTEIGVVAETIRDLAGRGVPVDEALATGEWPWPREPSSTPSASATSSSPAPRSASPSSDAEPLGRIDARFGGYGER